MYRFLTVQENNSCCCCFRFFQLFYRSSTTIGFDHNKTERIGEDKKDLGQNKIVYLSSQRKVIYTGVRNNLTMV